MARSMSPEEWQSFVSEGTRTGKLATVREDGGPTVVPVWFVLDTDGTFVFMTGIGSAKGKAMRREPRVALLVDDERPPFAFVLARGEVSISEDLEAMLPWSIRIAARYMGADRGEEFGRRNAVAGEVLVRLSPHTVVAQAGIAD